jgi:bifunctional oligoribonuclease and PAP phosphatase NrnA
MDPIIHQLNNSSSVLLVTHTHPDGDAIGSLIAMGLGLFKLNKKVTLYCEDSIPAVYRFLPSVGRIVQNYQPDNRFDTTIVLDCGDLQRVGNILSVVEQISMIINIDHHVTNTGFGNFAFVDGSACATTEIIYRFLKRMGIPIDLPIATAIYTGILTDTGSFRFSNTNLAAFSVCQEMVSLGVDPYNVAKHVYGTYSIDRIKLLNRALDSIEISANGKLSMMVLSPQMFHETQTSAEDIDGFINYARRIEDVRVAALINERDNGEHKSVGGGRIHVSLRSDGSIDVAQIAMRFGGGGHETAAGFDSDESLSQVKSEIVDFVERFDHQQ